MKTITVWIERKTHEEIAKVIVENVKTFSNDDYKNLTLEDCKNIIFNNIEKAVSSYCTSMVKHNKPAELNDPYMAFSFGAPLGDAVFMLTGCRLPDGVPQVSFAIPDNYEGLSESFTVDFYKHMH